MNTHHDPLDCLQHALSACEKGELSVAQLVTQLDAQWRSAASALPLPPRYAQVLGDLLDRLQAGALFSEESCSFSQTDLLAGLRLWADKARVALNS